ncbi:uncharacterized protein LOC133187964 [Saccostrea echinata]|uniref:uncharacterized protein LOC133187964 n=1 Tax=Saccostrea echinata TaxID=191078 RepID=UPI002A8366CD|nr:uncharacterized protein LOC133187964 [Saccostrea echinata]
MNVLQISAICVTLWCFTDSAALQKTDSDFWVDPEDCSKFYILRDGKEFLFKCPEDYVINSATRLCVPKGSTQDTCLKTLQKTQGVCSLTSHEKLANAENCAKYYDCDTKVSSVGEAEVKECPYPLLFDENSQRCHHYSTVQCGTRYEPKDACEYEENQCKSAHCIPCYMRFPSCKGSPDGLNPWKGKEGSPEFVVCKDERVVFQGGCQRNSDVKQRIFSPKYKICVDL